MTTTTHSPTAGAAAEFATRRAAAMFGLAIGDAWGDPVEFTSYAGIVARHGRCGPDFPAQPRITDDTQMSLAVWDALTASVHESGTYVPDQVGRALARTFRAWSRDRDNNRAPGTTCMGACAKLTSPGRWTRSGQDSMGCGTVMRAPWIGLHPHVLPADIGPLADLTAVVTHTHPGAVAAAHAVAVLTHEIAHHRVQPGQACEWLADYAVTTGPTMWAFSPAVAEIASQSHRDDATYIHQGWERIADAAAAAFGMSHQLAVSPWGFDPCKVLQLDASGGWDAVSALALAVGIFDGMCVGHPQAMAANTIRRAVTISGDADSVAAITGALVGAHYGFGYVPTDALLAIEDRYRDALTRRIDHADGHGAVPAPVFA